MQWNGWAGGWPMQWGGGPTLIESTHAALVAVVGQGHAADSDGIEWRWRECRAVGLAILTSYMDRALAQHDPQSATDALPFYREVFGLPDSLGDQDTRDTAHRKYHARPAADVPSVRAELKRIDPRFEILERGWSSSATTIPGRVFEDYTGAAPFRLGRGDSLFPAFSHAFELVVLFDITDAPTGPVEATAVQLARDYLDEALPAWVGYSIMGSTGFILDQSPLDWTGFDP